MKAIRVQQFGGAENLKLEEIPDPKPGPGQILIEMKVAGVNPVDAYIRNGTYSVKPPLPYTPGLDGAGLVQDLGDEFGPFNRGDHVYVEQSLTGTYAEKCLCETKHVHKLPSMIDFTQGAAIGIPYATAYRALFYVAKSLPGESVLIHGASGAVGLAAVQLARSHGMLVIGTASTEKGRELVLANGAHHVIDHSSPGVAEATLQSTHGFGANVIVEMLANKNLQTDLLSLAKRGRLVIVGNRGSIEVNVRDAMARDATIHGMTIFNATDEELTRIHAALFVALESKAARPIVSRKFQLSEAAEAQRAVMMSGNLGKIVLLV